MGDDGDVRVQLPFGPPPVCPDALKQLEQYLLCIEQLPSYNYARSHKIWPRVPHRSSLTNFHPSSFATTLKPERDQKTGKLLKFKEVFISELVDIDNCDKITPDPGMKEMFIDFENNLLNVPPGMDCGYDFHACDNQQFPGLPAKKNIVNLTNILQVEDSLGLNLHDKKKDKIKVEPEIKKPVAKLVNIDTEEQGVIPLESSIPVLKISETPSLKVLEKADWAEELDVKPVLDFHERVPKMAYTWDFKLDPFQQLAIVKLEEDCNVFVAAHTSAGKTVVAEYAIALSLQRCTRAIYTSPIKALSNQKYRDFRNNFEIGKKMGEVGLITGDIQLNPKAPCLIMTTEILRSMLYNKSEVVQDLEFVIFDEVHYINDPDRGHVWEEVMMLLQSHVKIVMLSATVPNAIEFANWVGQIKKKKVYLICTQNRPVPLHFYLYTGTHEGNTDNMFLIREAEGRWKHDGYCKADKSRIVVENPTKGRGDSRGRGRMRGNSRHANPDATSGVRSPKQEKNMWRSFINALKKQDKLPVVTFVLSRGRLDDTAEMLGTCLDLVDNAKSKSIKVFFDRHIQHLKEEDRNLPQVIKMGELLAKGIGVHHSGILPILKEIVEMLFQQGKVQLLLATETFAMGVNMPTKTVVFESIRKYDGSEWRNLLPAEFIQMAGRAGRRGIDKIGTVIIMCKAKVPGDRDLQNMMFNKPSKLESQFKMTYATILKNLLRTNEATNPVERLMSSSFKEFSEQSKHHVYKEQLVDVEKEYDHLMDTRDKVLNKQPSLGNIFTMLEDYFEDASRYISLRKEVQEFQLTHPKILKELVPGHVVVAAHGPFCDRLGLILAVDRNRKFYQVLIMVNKNEFEIRCSHNKELCVCTDETYFRMSHLVRGNDKFVPDGTNYRILKLEVQNIMELTNLTDGKKLNYDAILTDWRHGQFNRNRQPSDDTFRALQDLMEKSAYLAVNHIVNVHKKIEPVPLEYKSKHTEMQRLKNKLYTYNTRIVHDLDRLFSLVYQYKVLQKKIETYKRKINEFSMTQDFQSKLEILKELRYVDNSNNVELKGRGAIRMTTNEIMVTELIFHNILSDYEPAEIAALLSCLVFQAKTKVNLKEVREKLPSSLVSGMDIIEETHERLRKTEERIIRETNDKPPDESICEFNELNFGLIQVVYEWACDKVFSEIMKLTDVQEGIIVRCIQQLNEVLRCVKEVAQKVGDCTLESKMDKASNAIKRDIVFAASLYLQNEN